MVGNPLSSVPHTPRAFPFPWHKESYPGPPPSPSGSHPPPHVPPSSRVNEARGMESPHPPVPCPVPCAPPPFVRENRTQRGGAQGEGPGPSGGPTSTASGGENTVTDVAAGQHATQAGAVHANGRAGVRRRVQGEVEGHDSTPTCAQRVRVCERDQTQPGQGGCREWKGRAPIPYSHPVDRLSKKNMYCRLSNKEGLLNNKNDVYLPIEKY